MSWFFTKGTPDKKKKITPPADRALNKYEEYIPSWHLYVQSTIFPDMWTYRITSDNDNIHIGSMEYWNTREEAIEAGAKAIADAYVNAVRTMHAMMDLLDGVPEDE